MDKSWPAPGREGYYQLDEKATVARRKELREKRLARARPFKSWWIEQREKLKGRDFIPEVKAMYQDAFRSERFRKNFLDFWQLDVTF